MIPNDAQVAKNIPIANGFDSPMTPQLQFFREEQEGVVSFPPGGVALRWLTEAVAAQQGAAAADLRAQDQGGTDDAPAPAAGAAVGKMKQPSVLDFPGIFADRLCRCAILVDTSTTIAILCFSRPFLARFGSGLGSGLGLRLG